MTSAAVSPVRRSRTANLCNRVVMRVSWVNYGIRMSLCWGPIRPWKQIWPELMTLRIDHGA